MLLKICIPVLKDPRALSTTIGSLLSEKIEWGTTAEILVPDNFSDVNAAEQVEQQFAQLRALARNLQFPKAHSGLFGKMKMKAGRS